MFFTGFIVSNLRPAQGRFFWINWINFVSTPEIRLRNNRMVIRNRLIVQDRNNGWLNTISVIRAAFFRKDGRRFLSMECSKIKSVTPTLCRSTLFRAFQDIFLLYSVGRVILVINLKLYKNEWQTNRPLNWIPLRN